MKSTIGFDALHLAQILSESMTVGMGSASPFGLPFQDLEIVVVDQDELEQVVEVLDP